MPTLSEGRVGLSGVAPSSSAKSRMRAASAFVGKDADPGAGLAGLHQAVFGLWRVPTFMTPSWAESAVTTVPAWSPSVRL
jgi:hypothetical protein